MAKGKASGGIGHQFKRSPCQLHCRGKVAARSSNDRGRAMKKPPPVTRDERVTLAHAVHQLKEQHGPRITAHLLYHQARALTLEADRASEQDQQGQT
jgi:hypothetical protein